MCFWQTDEPNHTEQSNKKAITKKKKRTWAIDVVYMLKVGHFTLLLGRC